MLDEKIGIIEAPYSIDWDWGTGTREARREPGFLGGEHRLWKIWSGWIVGWLMGTVNPRRRRDCAISPIMKGEESHKQGVGGKMGWTSFSGQKRWQKRCFGATSRVCESNKSE